MTPLRTKRKKLRDAPLGLVLAEVRFSPVLAMHSRVADIQDRLRSLGFPDFSNSTIQQIEFTGAEPRFSNLERWLFGSKDACRFVILTKTSLAIEVTNYDSFEDFLRSLLPALQTLKEIVDPALVERVGLRYVNRLFDDPEHPAPFFLRPPVLPFESEELHAEKIMHSSQTVGKTEQGHVQVRLTQLENGPGLPADLISQELMTAAQPRPGITTILDIDASTERREDFEASMIVDMLWQAHEHTQTAFWASVTDDALAYWGDTEEEVGEDG